MPKYRRNSKIKQEHTMIEGLGPFLREIESWPEIKSILTGVITTRKASGAFKFQVQYPTDSGLKCLAKNQGSVQEVFITSATPKKLQLKILNYWLER